MTLAQESEQGGEHGVVPAGEGGLGAAVLQDGQLLPEYKYLDFLGRGGAGQQAQPAGQEAAESVGQTERHDSQACADGLTSAFDVITQ
ncbi:hypothetical protein [Streptomyces sp. NPDC046805]|uniref:hypothetical protein n=1 Tax=Streptomyces sp. NPDC046805 TaxID=3155134 RepID=UPI003403AA02